MKIRVVIILVLFFGISYTGSVFASERPDLLFEDFEKADYITNFSDHGFYSR